MSPLWWMFLGYSLMWAAIVLYVANLGRRQAALHRELEALAAAVDATAAEDAAPAAGSGAEGRGPAPARPAR